MPFIRIQNPKYNDKGQIIGGSASIVESVYQKDGKSKCKQILRESLGTIMIMEDRKRGVFLSKTRGLIRYDVEKDEFESVPKDIVIDGAESALPEPRVHTLFGDTFLALSLMKEKGILTILKNIAGTKGAFYQKMICHTMHELLRDGAKICCDRFVERSFISQVTSIPSSVLRTDTRYYKEMGSYEIKIEFFKRFVERMRSMIPNFGRGCYVDSTPLPNTISDLPGKRLCSHGVDSTCEQIRLVLVLDIRSGFPVWYDIIPGNVLDLNTIMNVTERVSRTLGISIEDYVLDAGYVCREVIKAYNCDNNKDKTLIARLPGKKGYKRDILFTQTHNLFGNAKYAFVRNGHSYFGIKKDLDLFKCKEFAYVYVDVENASSFFKEYLSKHNDEYEKMTMKEKNDIRYKGGFFVLVSNIESTPDRILDLYFGRTEIESVINADKEFLTLLPLNKQSDTAVAGKLLQNMITLITFLMMRKVIVPTGRSVSDTIYDLQSVMCFRQDGNTISIENVNAQARHAFELFDMKPPSRIDVSEFKSKMYLD